MLKENKERFGLRKLSVGLASVMLGVVAVSGVKNTTVHADTLDKGVQEGTVQEKTSDDNSDADKPVQVVKEVAPQVNAKSDAETVRGGD